MQEKMRPALQRNLPGGSLSLDLQGIGMRDRRVKHGGPGIRRIQFASCPHLSHCCQAEFRVLCQEAMCRCEEL